MKKYIILITSVLSIACSNKKADNENSVSDKTEIENACSCNELTVTRKDYLDDYSLDNTYKNVLKDGKPYTGSCIDKDQNDSITRKIDFKNGWTVKRIVKRRMGSKYIVESDIDYDNLNPLNGFGTTIEDDGNGILYTSEVSIFKDGKRDEQLSYTIVFSQSYTVSVNQRENEDGDYIWDSVDGLRLVISNNMKDKLGDCLKLLTDANNLNNEEEYFIEGASKQQAKEVLDCLKEHLDKFNYSIK